MSDDRLRLAREVGQLGHRLLHPVGQLVLRDAGEDLGIAGLRVMEVVEGADVVEHLPAGRLRAAGRVGEVEHRVLAAAELHALIAGRQESAAPEAVVERLVGPSAREQDDERRQVLVQAPQAVGDPGAHARPAGELRAGLHERDRRVVVDRLGLHRADDRDVVDDPRRVGQELAEPCAALAVLRELEDRRGDGEALLPRGHRRDPLAHPHRVGQLDPAPLADRRLVVEQVHLRRCAGLEQVDDPLGLGGEMRQTRQAAGLPVRVRPVRRWRGTSVPARTPSPSSSEPRATAPRPSPDRARKSRRLSCWAIFSSSTIRLVVCRGEIPA